MSRAKCPCGKAVTPPRRWFCSAMCFDAYAKTDKEAFRHGPISPAERKPPATKKDRTRYWRLSKRKKRGFALLKRNSIKAAARARTKAAAPKATASLVSETVRRFGFIYGRHSELVIGKDEPRYLAHLGRQNTRMLTALRKAYPEGMPT
jgi:hypothetical protein